MPEPINTVEFTGRLLLHVLPKGFMRIRHYGFLANRCKNHNLKKCRKLSGFDSSDNMDLNKTVGETVLEKTGTDITKCPFCKKGSLVFMWWYQVSRNIPVLIPYEIIHSRHTHNLVQRE